MKKFVKPKKWAMPTLLVIICVLAFYGLFRAACDVGAYLKRQREAQEAIEESQKIIEQHGKEKKDRRKNRGR